MITNDDYRQLAQVHKTAHQPDEIFDAVRAIVQKRIGFGLLTMLKLTSDGEEVQRLYTTDPINYPIAGRERLGATPWGQHVLVEQRAYLGADLAGLKWAFPADFDLIVSLGLGATMNVPIVALGRTLGSMNILGAEGCYATRDLDAASTLAPYLQLSFLTLANSRQ